MVVGAGLAGMAAGLDDPVSDGQEAFAEGEISGNSDAVIDECRVEGLELNTKEWI
jgi:hypothetical protein